MLINYVMMIHGCFSVGFIQHQRSSAPTLVAATFLSKKYAEHCTLKFIQKGPEDVTWVNGVLSYLKEIRAHHTWTTFDVNANQTFIDKKLDLFLTWEKPCVVNIVHHVNRVITLDPARLDYALKLSTRDRSSLYFVAYTGDIHQKNWLFQRLRNLPKHQLKRF